MNNFVKEYQEFYKVLKTLPARISRQVVEDLTKLITEKYMDLYDLISKQSCNCKCSNQSNVSSQMEDINNLLEQLEHIKKESERIAADNIELRKDLDVAKETNRQLYHLVNTRNTQLEEAGQSLKDYELKMERLERDRVYHLKAANEARDDIIYWEKKYRELYTKYIDLRRKKRQNLKSNKIKQKEEEHNCNKKMALYKDSCLKVQHFIPFTTYTNVPFSSMTESNYITVSDVKLY